MILGYKISSIARRWVSELPSILLKLHLMINSFKWLVLVCYVMMWIWTLVQLKDLLRLELQQRATFERRLGTKRPLQNDNSLVVSLQESQHLRLGTKKYLNARFLIQCQVSLSRAWGQTFRSAYFKKNRYHLWRFYKVRRDIVRVASSSLEKHTIWRHAEPGKKYIIHLLRENQQDTDFQLTHAVDPFQK